MTRGSTMTFDWSLERAGDVVVEQGMTGLTTRLWTTQRRAGAGSELIGTVRDNDQHDGRTKSRRGRRWDRDFKAERAERACWRAGNRASTGQGKRWYCRKQCEDERRVDEDLGCATHDTLSACRATERWWRTAECGKELENDDGPSRGARARIGKNSRLRERAMIFGLGDNNELERWRARKFNGGIGGSRRQSARRGNFDGADSEQAIRRRTESWASSEQDAREAPICG
jgi:hypothetical protein